MSVVIEWRYAGVDQDEATLQLGWQTILPPADLEAGVPIHIPADPVPPATSTQRRLLPPEADAYFRAQLLTIHESDPLSLQPQFSIVIGTDGTLTLATDGAHEPLTLTQGQAALIPHGAGITTVSGAGSAIRCLPPAMETETGAAAW